MNHFGDVDELPVATNPRRGWLATANEMNLPDDFPAHEKVISFDWYAPSRAERLAEVLDDLAETVRGLELHRYPDREATELREALALHAGHGFEGTWAANGSNEVLQQLLLAFAGPGRTALVVEPTYAMHSLLARATGTHLVTRVQPRDQLLDPAAAADLVAEAAADLTFWCSPNNPTGEATGPDVLAAVCAAAPGLVVVDEAYGEFGTSHAAGLLSRFPNLVVTRTFSKAFGLAGLRFPELAVKKIVQRNHLPG